MHIGGDGPIPPKDTPGHSPPRATLSASSTATTAGRTSGPTALRTQAFTRDCPWYRNDSQLLRQCKSEAGRPDVEALVWQPAFRGSWSPGHPISPGPL
ncbi:Hypothetical protein AA314_04469 [Archangium gephyra]|uniref:Uncharacterized protein n=1 Tax=Archangium gephyra TaxID=48 RepID=A0AAC8Q959_9BACT|nr:Hypothetical protein AA314_04469 [Archangium gephyra]